MPDTPAPAPISIGSTNHPLFQAGPDGLTVFTRTSNSEWDEKYDQWLVIKRHQPLIIPWHAVLTIDTGNEKRTIPGHEIKKPGPTNALIIRLEIEPSINLNDCFFGHQGYTRNDLVGLSKDEYNEDDLVSRIVIPQRHLNHSLEETASQLKQLHADHAETSREAKAPYRPPKPVPKKPNPLAKWLIKKFEANLKN